MNDETNDANAAPATRCCERDYDGDGNCDVHIAPGVFRRRAEPATTCGYALDAAGNVVLTMTRADYVRLLAAMGFYIGAVTNEYPAVLDSLLAWTNRLAAGDTEFTPYATSGE